MSCFCCANQKKKKEIETREQPQPNIVQNIVPNIEIINNDQNNENQIQSQQQIIQPEQVDFQSNQNLNPIEKSNKDNEISQQSNQEQQEKTEAQDDQKIQEENDEILFDQILKNLNQQIIKFFNNTQDPNILKQFYDKFQQNKQNQNIVIKVDRLGPAVKDKRMQSIGEDEKQCFPIEHQQFEKWNDEIILERLIEKPKHNVCTYLGKIQQKYCCVKLIPGVKSDCAQKWIETVNLLQQTQDYLISQSFQIYHYYKLEQLDDDHQNIYIITKLEQYNAYTLAIDQDVTIEQKAEVAYKLIQLLEITLSSKYRDNQNDKINNFSENKIRIIKNILSLKNNNILISFNKQNPEVFISDWQLLLDEFQNIITLKEIQNNQSQMQDLLHQTSQNLMQLHQSNQILAQDKEAKNQVQKFIKQTLNLIFFGVNRQLQLDQQIKGFVTEGQLKELENDFAQNSEDDQQIVDLLNLKIKSLNNNQSLNQLIQVKQNKADKIQFILDIVKENDGKLSNNQVEEIKKQNLSFFQPQHIIRKEEILYLQDQLKLLQEKITKLTNLLPLIQMTDNIEQNQRQINEKTQRNEKLNDQEIRFCLMKSKIFARKLNLDTNLENYKVSLIYLILKMKSSESMRPKLMNFIVQGSHSSQPQQHVR